MHINNIYAIWYEQECPGKLPASMAAKQRKAHVKHLFKEDERL